MNSEKLNEFKTIFKNAWKFIEFIKFGVNLEKLKKCEGIPKNSTEFERIQEKFVRIQCEFQINSSE